MIAVQEVQQLVDLALAEAPDIVGVVDVAGRGAHQHEIVEQLRRRLGRQHTDHRADRVADEDAAFDIERAGDLHHVFRIARQRGVLQRIIGREVRAAGPDVVEQHHAEAILEVRRHEAPHVMVAAEPMREHHGAVAPAADLHIVTPQNFHLHPPAAPLSREWLSPHHARIQSLAGMGRGVTAAACVS